MMRMVQSRSAEQAKDYFNEALVKADYYLEDQERNGQVQGHVADRLGITGLANKNIFFALCENLHPLTGETLTQRNVENRTIGYDINFHCPKSVSVLHVLSDDNHIAEAFQSAVNETMLDIEQDALTRIRRNGQQDNRETGELVWVDFLHQTARSLKDQPPDPHLHSHCFVFNVTWDKTEQCFKAVQFRHIKRDMPYYQAKFHARLADKLVAVGYRIRRTKTAFEIENVPQAAIDLFSKRSNEIGRIAKELNITDAKQLDALGAKTRQRKQKDLSLSDLKKIWRKQIKQLGLADNTAIRFENEETENITAQECVAFAVADSFERRSVMEVRRVLAAAYRHGLGKKVTGNIEAAFQQDKNIVKVMRGDTLCCTTLEILAEERQLIIMARKGKEQCKPLYPELPVIGLDGEQRHAVAQIMTTTDRLTIIEGRAGTGKTTLMQEAVRLIEQAGKTVIVVAPTSEAARGVLRNEGFTEAETLAALLTSPHLQYQLQDNVLWVDEAGLANTKEMLALLQLAQQYNARVVLGGDIRQHSPVARGDALRLLRNHAGITVCGVNRIFRQKWQDYCDAVTCLADGDIIQGFQKLESMDAIRQGSKGDIYALLIADYMAAVTAGKSALIISPTHTEGEIVITELRAVLRRAGHLGANDVALNRLINCNFTQAQKTDWRFYEAGQVIGFIQNLPGFRRGSKWQIMAVNEKEIIIQDYQRQEALLPLSTAEVFQVYRQDSIDLATGDLVRITQNCFDLDKKRLNNGQVLEVISIGENQPIELKSLSGKAHYRVAHDIGHIAPAYCLTSHASQGKTVDHVFILQPSGTFPATNSRQFYVSVSRGRESVTIYTDDKSALLEHAMQTGDRMTAMELMQGNFTPLANVFEKNAMLCTL